MSSVARLCVWAPAERLDALAEGYELELMLLLRERGLEASSECGRQTVPGVLSRLFELETPAAITATSRSLRKDPAWQEVLAQLGRRLAGTEQPLRYSFGVYRTPAGPGRTMEAGPGFRQGLWHSYGTPDGLPSPTIMVVSQDREGDLWLGSWGHGLIRYDGAEFTTFTTADGLADNWVGSILEDREGCLWFGTQGGVCRYDGTGFEAFTTADGLGRGWVHALLEDRAGRLWAGTDHGLCRCDSQPFTAFTKADGLSHDQVLCLLEDRSGCLWVGAVAGLSRREGARFAALTEGLVEHAWVDALLEDSEGQMWIGTRGMGALRYDGRQFTHFATEHGLGDDRVSCLLEDREKRLWLGCFGGGVCRREGEGLRAFTTEDGLANDSVLGLCEDREGNLWVATQGAGLSRYDQGQFVSYTVKDGLPSNGVMCLLEGEGGLWIGTLKGACRWDGRCFSLVEELEGRQVWWALNDEKSHLWFGVYGGGVVRYDGERFISFTTADGLAGDEVVCLLQDRKGCLWVGTRTGLSRYDLSAVPAQAGGARFTNFTTADGLVGDVVTSLLEDKAGNLWIATRSGVSRYDGETFTNFTREDGLAGEWTTCVLEDRKGGMWIGAFGGLSRYDLSAKAQAGGEDFITFTMEHGLASDHLLFLLEDRDGTLWISTWGGGVSRYDGQVFQTLSRQDGLVHDTVQQILQDHKGDIWIATEGGLTRYRPSRTPPKVRIKDVVADQHYGPVAQVQVPASHRLLAFEFQGRSWTTRPEGMAYVYRLEGHDLDWTATHSRRVEYRHLPLGTYTFQVQAVDRDLNYSDPAAVQVSVVPDPRLEALTQALSRNGAGGEFVGTSAALQQAQSSLAEVAPTDLTVLILGETGTGKGLAARAVHGSSRRQAGPFLQVSCGAIPEGLVESELFGHEKGAFTGAVSRQLGKVELAEGGTLFLDEIGDLPLVAQVKLLRLLEERQYERVGGSQTLKADVRVVAATNRDLRQMVQAGTFREDLYYRLQGFAVRLPPLRERVDDIPLLAAYFVERLASHLDRSPLPLGPEALAALRAYDWPGNVRELEHAVQRALLVCHGEVIGVEELARELGPDREGLVSELVTLAEQERRYIRQVLEQTGWRVKGSGGAAAVLGLHHSTLRSRMKKLGIERQA